MRAPISPSGMRLGSGRITNRQGTAAGVDKSTRPGNLRVAANRDDNIGPKLIYGGLLNDKF